MSVSISRSLTWDIHLPLSWTWMSAVREMVNSGLKDCDDALREDITMVASELAENVVKYGEPVERAASGSLQLIISAASVRVVSTNGVRSRERVEQLGRALRRIQNAENPRTLYLERMKELMANPAQAESQLGLLRIAYEGEFVLSHTYDDQVLTITAERKVP